MDQRGDGSGGVCGWENGHLLKQDSIFRETNKIRLHRELESRQHVARSLSHQKILFGDRDCLLAAVALDRTLLQGIFHRFAT